MRTNGRWVKLPAMRSFPRRPAIPFALLAIALILPMAVVGSSSSARAAPRSPATVVRSLVGVSPTPGGLLDRRRENSPGDYRWPLDGPPRLVRRFDPPPQPWLAGHRGVDLAAPPGVLVRASGAAVVGYAGSVAGREVVSLTHPGGLRTTYEPLRPLVVAGDRVAAGEPVGILLPGHPRCPISACLHWGLRQEEEYLDPLTLLGLGRVRLLPLTHTTAADSTGRDR